LRSEDLIEVDLAGTHRKGSRQDITELDLQLPEIALLMGEVPCVPYATAGSPALGDAAEPFLAHTSRSCSPITVRSSLEHAARILLAARALGKVTRLTREQIDALERMRGMPSHGQNDLGY
jgi:ribulose-5-phosphate 4-epimerase/fuculose-1-phosphate aldolase